ncbi:MAG: 2-hydroxyacyl-CoA dehydratase [Acidaminobacteraceae bacterium]
MKKIGITTTVPSEVLLAAGYQPVDLNNIFSTSDDYKALINRAERDGFPKSMCAVIKGIYGVCKTEDIDTVIGVLEGDCSSTKVLLEVLELHGVKMIPFGFPHGRGREDLKNYIDRLMDTLNVTIEQVEKKRKELFALRELGKRIDELTYIDNKASGFENHLSLVCFSDYDGDAIKFESELRKKIVEIEKREAYKDEIRIAYLGVPPMTEDIYEYVESLGARVVYNETQREFMFPRASDASDIYEQYRDFTYPYDNKFRLIEIEKQIELREIDCVIHYTQAFCHRAVEDILIKNKLSIPVLNIEGDKDSSLDARSKLRLEAFLDMIKDVRRKK